MSLDHEIHIKEENEDLENSSIESNFLLENLNEPSKNQNTKKYVDMLNTCQVCGEKWFATQLDLEKHQSEKHDMSNTCKTESDISCANTKVVLVTETDGFREYLLPFGWSKEFKKRLLPDYSILRYGRDRWDVFYTG